MKNSGHKIIAFSAPTKTLGYSGERFTDAMTGAIDHEHRHRYLFAVQFCQGKRVLDVACGEGYGSALLATVAHDVTGVDIDGETISHARAAYSEPNLNFEVGDATAIPVSDASVDVVVSFETIEHFEDHNQFLQEIRRVLAPGGVVIISSPIREVYSRDGEWENPFHVRELSRDEFVNLISEHFNNIACYEQKAMMGSLIVPDPGVTEAPFTSFSRLDKQRFAHHTGGIIEALYAIVVASDIALPHIAPWGALEDNGYAEELANIIRYNEALIANTRAEGDRLKAESDRLKERNRYLVSAVHRAEQRTEADTRALREEVSALKKRTAALNKKVARLRSAVKQRDKQLHAVFASTSWRATMPIRWTRRAIGLAKKPHLLGELARISTRHLKQHGIAKTLRKLAIGEARARVVNHLAAIRPSKSQLPSKSNATKNEALPKITSDEELATLPAVYSQVISRSASSVLPLRVLIVAELSLAQCAKYRVWQKVEHFRTLGIECSVIEWWQHRDVRNALQTHSLAIFYRTPGYPELLKNIAEAKRLGVPTLWEADDLIFDEQEYRANRNVDLLEPSLRQSVLAGIPLFRAALRACDYGLASTETLAAAMLRAGVGDAFVVENALDGETLAAAEAARSDRQTMGIRPSVRIVYGSGSKAHDADFQCASGALAILMERNPDVDLEIIGDLTLPIKLDRFSHRVTRRPFVDYQTYLRQLAEADISLAPLEATIFNDAKSNIKFLEAAAVGLPSVCSPRAAFRGVVQHGVNGFLAETEAEWLEALTCLVSDSDLRHRMGAQALQDVLHSYGPTHIAQHQVLPVAERFGHVDSKKLRVLVANIFFAPHSFGGATIVAEELASRLACKADAEVAVFTSWGNPQAKPYDRIRFDARGVTCFGVRLPPMEPRSLEYYNPKMAESFAEILKAFRPDIVHLHSIQGLSASIALACRGAGIPYVITLHDAWWLCERQFMIRADGKYCFQEKIDPSVCAKCVVDASFTAVRQETLREVLEGAALLLTPSAFHRALHISNGIAPEKIVVNKNGVRTPDVPPVRGNDGRLRFGFVGGKGPIKGLDLIRKAFEELNFRNYELLLIDNTLNLGFSSVSVDDWNIQGAVKVIPAYTQDTMDDFFSSIDVLLFPSQWKESFGLTVREALSRNVWVIVTDSGGAAEDVVDGVNGNIIPIGEEVRPLCDAIAVLLGDPSILNNFINPAKGMIVDFDSQASELYEILNSTVKLSRANETLTM